MLAAAAVGHGVVEFEVAVELGLDVELLDGGVLGTLAGVAADAGAGRLLLGGLADDALILAEGALLKPTLAELVLAGEPTPLEALVRVERAGNQVRPVKAVLPVIKTEVVRVARGGELRGVEEAEAGAEASSCDLAEASSQGDERCGVLHCDFNFFFFFFSFRWENRCIVWYVLCVVTVDII